MSRGPGAAALTWGEETPELADAMEARSLPAPNDLDELTELLGLASSAPEVAPRSEAVPTAGAGPGTLGEGSFQRRLHPRHRQAVRDFFDRDP